LPSKLAAEHWHVDSVPPMEALPDLQALQVPSAAL
jgi:hypothetical protein